MKKITKISGSIFFIIILLIVPNIQATEFQVVKDDIEEQIEENIFDDTVVNIIDIWDLIEFLHFLLISFIIFILNLLQKFAYLLLSPFILIYYLILVILYIIFPH